MDEELSELRDMTVTQPEMRTSAGSAIPAGIENDRQFGRCEVAFSKRPKATTLARVKGP
jgi:hypothetical protein